MELEQLDEVIARVEESLKYLKEWREDLENEVPWGDR